MAPALGAIPRQFSSPSAKVHCHYRQAAPTSSGLLYSENFALHIPEKVVTHEKQPFMATKNPTKPANKNSTPNKEAPTAVGTQKSLLINHSQALAAHAHALTAHALALSAHAQALSAAAADDVQAAPLSQSASCVFICLRRIAPGADITNNSILSRIPIPDLVALGRCINSCVPLNDPNCWGGGVNIDGNWRVSDLIDETETLRKNG